MRKLLLTAIAAIVSCATSWAQPIMGYSFTSSVGTYTEITDGTKMTNPDDLANMAWMGSADAVSATTTGAGFDIGFDFQFNNQTMNKFAIFANFALVLGKDEFTVDPGRSRFLLIDDDEGRNENLVASLVNDFQNVMLMTETDEEGNETVTTEVSYKVVGEAPNRTLVVQYKNVGVKMSWNSAVACDMQIRLNETSNTIDIVYNGWTDEFTGDYEFVSKTMYVGLKGTLDDIYTRTYNTETCDWQNTIAGSADSALKLSGTCNLVDGLTYTFIPPTDCVAPTVQPTDLVLNSGSSFLKGSFTAAEDVDRYLVLLTKDAAPGAEDLPVDGTMYSRLDVIGNSTVLGYSADLEFTTFDKYGVNPEVEILPATTYYVTVIAANSLCIGGPKYNLTEPLQGFTASMPAAPASLIISGKGTKSMEAEFVGNAAGNDVIVAYTTVPLQAEGYTSFLGQGVFGQPTSDLQTGDTIEGGGEIIYIGPAAEATWATAYNLNPNDVYHFAAWSKDAAGQVSTDALFAQDITDGAVPYEFNMPDMFGGCVFGVEMQNIKITYDSSQEYTFAITKGAIDNDYTVTTQWITPAEGINRVIYDITLWTQTGMSWRPTITGLTEWQEGEEFVVEYTTDETTWTPVSTLNSENAPAFTGKDSYIQQVAIFESDGTPVKLRLRYTCKTANAYGYIKNFRLEEKKACDYPVSLAASNISMDKATLTWASQGTESEWLVEWRAQGTETWNSATTEKPEYTVSGLPGRAVIEARVAAKCGETEQSDYSKTITFVSGYLVPFTEEFLETTLPVGWEFKTGELTESTTLEDGGSWEFVAGRGMSWIQSESPVGPFNSWLLTPVLDLGDGDVNYTMTFTMDNMYASTDSDESISIVISTDGGKTFSKANTLLSGATVPTEEASKLYSVSLKGYSGECRIGLLTTATTGTGSYLMITKVAVEESCPNDAVIQTSEVQGTFATVAWTGTKDETQDWMLFIRKKGETTKDYTVKTQETTWTFTDLEPRTTYEVGVTKACAEDDIARPATVTFTTLAKDPCYPVEDLTATANVYYITFNWTFEADRYNLRYRKQGSETWKQKEFNRPNMSIYDLEPATAYEYAIQAVCSDAEGDVSDWTETAVVTTLEEACKAPTDITAEVTHKNAVVSWTGTADSYEVEYRLATEEEYNAVIVSEASITLEDLEPETTYAIRVRSLCPDTYQDYSLWTAVTEFTTAAIPECVAPKNLRVEEIGEGEATLLWDADESNLSWDLNWRATAVTSWNEVLGMTETSCKLTELEPETAYIYRVMATCDEGRTSGWSEQVKFTTLESGIDAITSADFAVYTKAGMLNVINAEGIQIDDIAIYDADGKLLGAYEINSTDNVLVNTNISGKITVVKIISGQQTLTFKVVFK